MSSSFLKAHGLDVLVIFRNFDISLHNSYYKFVVSAFWTVMKAFKKILS